MRFEAKAALAIGILLPVLETYRRGLGHWNVEFSSMFEDYLAGALLLAGAWAAYRRHSSHGAILLAGWAWVTQRCGSSTFVSLRERCSVTRATRRRQS